MLEMMSLCDGKALTDITLEIKEKESHTLLCATVSQRSALVRAMCGVGYSQSGEIKLDGKVLTRTDIQLRQKIRIVPHTLYVDDHMTVEEYLCFTADALGLERDKSYRQISEAIELCFLEDVQRRILKKLTSAQQTRLSLAAALLGNPEYIVLEEPFDGLVGETKNELFDLLSMLAKIKTLVLITKKPSEALRLCESISVIAHGKVMLSGRIEDIEKKINSTHELILSVRGDKELILSVLQNTESVIATKLCKSEANGVHTISVEHIPDTAIRDKLFAALGSINAPMLSYRQVKLTLDDVYYSLTKDEKDSEFDEKKSMRRRGKKA